jgi:glutathione S-transferase
MVHLRSTHGCVNTPRILFALEEMGVPYRVETVPDGTFTARYGIPGPELVDGERKVVEVGAILRHVVRTYGAGTLWPSDRFDQAECDRWLDFQAIRIARAAAARDVDTLGTLLSAFERHISKRTWILGDEFTVADCGFIPAMLKRDKFPLETYPAIAAYFDRLGARPAWKRAVDATPR